MRPELKKSILVLPLLAILAGGSVTHAQDWSSDDPRGTVLVTPEGDLLGYVPDAGDVTVRYNKRGRKVLIDHYGNIVATEMPATRYLSRRENRRERLPGVESYENDGGRYANNQDDGFGNPEYFPQRPRSDDESGDVTGSVPGSDDGQQGVFEDQALPSDGIQSDNMNGEQDLAALEPLQPVIEVKPDVPTIPLTGKKSKFEITALQVFLDREGASPGVIDGKMGSNVTKALVAYEKISGETLDPNNTEDILTRLGFSGGLPVTSYTITSADAAGPYVASIPEDYSQKAALPSMAYTSVTEALAERFHMDENYLKELNPGVDFTMPGSTIKVINPGAVKKAGVSRIVADKARKQLFAYDEAGGLIASYPASIGSSDTPSPSGVHIVERIALDPNYTYNPKINFQQGQNTKVLTIPPGPNGPVGTVWIALDKPTYGIHGTPDPSRIGRSQSHGCIRLTNWDATELAKMVKPGVAVEFID
ncbi:L,D-transpeptidase [Rhizobium sp. KVB221]|uniref:L,D-transpeptidase n=1 Tax=Rhizobium setariae TaxID=2801340 RepID=A0A937CNB7_9HYPH|nr:L,D-transpeptidase [Rhizobium setariae]MBL0375305.1 L,D-transpeptidase [Rhizobium setariae]